MLQQFHKTIIMRFDAEVVFSIYSIRAVRQRKSFPLQCSMVERHEQSVILPACAGKITDMASAKGNKAVR